MTDHVLGNLKKGLLFVISAPAGTGKTTLVEMLLNEFPHALAESCSCTTRRPRPGEIPKKHYEFVSKEEFEEKVVRGEFLEYAEVFGNLYGTTKEEVKRHQTQARHVILVIDTQGAKKLMGKIEATFIFILPPSEEELKKRLLKRRTESETMIAERLSWARHEMAAAPLYDYTIVNDKLLVSYEILRSILIAEERRNKNVR